MESRPPSYNQVVTENSTLPSYEEVIKDIKNEQRRDNYCSYFIISILFIILLIIIPVILATLTNKNENV